MPRTTNINMSTTTTTQRAPRRRKPRTKVAVRKQPTKITDTTGSNTDQSYKVGGQQSVSVPKRFPRSPQVAKGNPWDNMSACAQKYAMAITNPFKIVNGSDTQENLTSKHAGVNDGVDACIPTFPPLKSRRLKVFNSGNFYTGVNADGWLAFAPRRLANNYSGFADQPPIIYSLQNWAGTGGFQSLDQPNPLPADQGYANLNSDYSTAELNLDPHGVGITSRVVAAGLRVRYVGQELTRGGTIHAIEQPNHDTLSDVSLAEMSQYESHFRTQVARKWVTLVYTPTLANEFNYQADAMTSASNFAITGGQSYDHFMGFYISSASAGAIFEYEAVVLMEVIGSKVRDLKDAETDIVGLSSVVNSINPMKMANLNTSGPRALQTSMAKNVTTLTGSPTLGAAASIVTDVAKVASLLL